MEQRNALIAAVFGLCVACLTTVSPALARDEPATRTNGQLQTASDPTEPSFLLPADGLVLRYRRIPGEIGEGHLGPSIEIHADGRILVRRPVYMKRPGTWQGQMEMNGLLSLVGELVSSGLVESERAELMERRLALLRQRAAVAEKAGTPRQVFAVSDPDVSELEIVLERYKPKGELGDGGTTGPIRRTWTWSNLHGDARRFPEIRELAAFDRVEHMLVEWMERDSLQKMEEEEP